MNNKRTITIGIPAYNEAHNIERLLRALLQQTISNQILEIIVISDNSTDHTVEEALAVHDTRIKVSSQRHRIGKNATLNNIFKKVKGTIFVQLDADVIPSNDHFLENIISPIVNTHVDLVAAHVTAMRPKTHIEFFTTFGHIFRTAIYQRIHRGDNVYLCYGRARAFSQKLFSQLRFPNECPEDSYSYLYLKKNKGKFVYQKNAEVLFRSPANYYDYVHQSNSFVAGEKALQKFFPTDVVTNAYKIPLYLYIEAYWSCLRSRPVYSIAGSLGYIGLTIYRKYAVRIPNRYTSKYAYLTTTKITSENNDKIAQYYEK